MTVYFIGAGPGDPELLTRKAERLIGECPVCLYAGSLVPEEILGHCPQYAKVINTASLEQLQLLPRVGPALAGRIIEFRETANDGDIVVALIDESETTLKRFKRSQRGKYIKLIPENREMEPMVYEAERVRIQGVLIGQMRKY